MPYIPEKDRGSLKPHSEHAAVEPGELNYQLTSVALTYLQHQKWCNGVLRYSDFANVAQAFTCAFAELYRRIGAPLEDAAIARNGDLPEFKDLP